MKDPTRPDGVRSAAHGMRTQAPWAIAAVAIVSMMLHRQQPPPWQADPPHELRPPVAASSPVSRMEPWMDFHGVMVESELGRIGSQLKKPRSVADFWIRHSNEAAGIRKRMSRAGKGL